MMEKGLLSDNLALGRGESLDYNLEETFIDAFLRQVAKTPDLTAVADEFGQITYQELNHNADTVAACLLSGGITTGEFVAVKMPRVKEFLVAVIGIWKAGAAYLPIDSTYPEERIQYMLHGSGARIVIDQEWIQQAYAVGKQQRTDKCPKADDTAVLIYTSGSTGKPKGVLIPHAAVRALCDGVQLCKYEDGDIIGQILSFSYVISCFDLFTPLSYGNAVFILNQALLTDLPALDKYIREHNISIITIVPQIAIPLIRNFHTPLRVLGIGGDKIEFSEECDAIVCTGYGLTETCSAITFINLRDKPAGNAPILGRPIPGVTIVLEDESGNPVPVGEIGEICISSPQLAKGYWHNEELTAEVFVNRPWSQSKVFRTGDLGRWNEEGILEFHGRKDEMVKIRGNRVELSEVEGALMKVDGIRAAAAVMKDVNGESLLCGYYVADTPIADAALRSALEVILPPYMIPSLFVRMESLPKLPNGKTDRKALPEPEFKDTDTVMPETAREQKIHDIVAGVLKTEHFGVTTNLISVGMTSIAAMHLSVKLQQKYGTTVRMTDLMLHPTVKSLAALVEGATDTDNRYGTVHPVQEYYPLTENQKGVYIDWERHRDGLQYNVPHALKMNGIDAGRLAQAIRQVVNARPILKMRLATVNGEVMQHRCDAEEAQVALSSLPAEVQRDEESIKTYLQSRVRAFDLFGDTLYRFEIYTDKDEVYLFKDIHHIVTDGLSEGRLIGEIFNAYEGKETENEGYTFYDYALESSSKEEDETYFKELIGDTEATVCPRSRDAGGKGRSKTVSIDMSKSSIEAERSKQGVTASNYILHSLMQVLRSITREDRVLIAAVSNGRSHSCMQPCQGFFVKTLPVLSEDTAADLQRQFIQSISHEEYPLTKIVESTGIHPEILYVYEGELYGKSSDRGEIEPISLSLDTPKLPITITVNPDIEDKYVITAEYDDSLFTEKDMLTLLNSVKTMSTEGRLVTKEEEQALIELGTGEKLDYDRTKTFVDLFTEQARKTPDNTAVVDKDSQNTYRELDEQSNAVAHWLIEEYDIKPDDFVAVVLPRKKEFITSALGIMKAGAAYVPIDPEYPEDRKRFMISDCEAKVVINEETWNDIAFADARHSHINRSKPEGLAYMIYTSGSTGQPKGVMYPHRGVVNLTKKLIELGNLKSGDRCAEYASFSFDMSIDEICAPLASGSCTYIISEEVRLDYVALSAYLSDNSIKGLTLPTTVGMTLLEHLDNRLEYVILAGEKLLPVHERKTRVINGYGPTECQLCHYYEVDKDSEYQDIPIGRSLPHIYSYVLDKCGRLIPKGQTGELYVAGIQTSLGYWHRPELTAEKFVDCPYLKGEKMYRTGDLVRWNEEGQLEYIGRTDNQIKLRGYRIELGEIESAAMKIEGVSQTVAMVKNDTLCLYYTGEASKETIKAELSKTLTDYMVPGIFIHLEAMPLTPNGKTDRKALPEPEISGATYEAPADTLEQRIYDAAAQCLGCTDFGVTDNLISYGLSSIKAMRLSAALSASGTSIRVLNILSRPTIREMAETVRTSLDVTRYKVHEVREYYPLTENQRLLYLSWLHDRDAVQYNMPSAWYIPSEDVARMYDSLIAIVNAHPHLKTRLVQKDDDVMQQRRDDCAANVTIIDTDQELTREYVQSRIRPFNLDGGDLHRMEIHRSSRDGHRACVIIDVHHIIGDGLSMQILQRDLRKSLAGQTIAAEQYSAYDFAVDQQDLTGSAEYGVAGKWFDSLITGREVTVYPHSYEVQREPGLEYRTLEMDGAAIDEYCRKYGFTKSNYFLTAFLYLLHEVTREDDLLITTINNGRHSSLMTDTTGMFLTTLPVSVSDGTLMWKGSVEDAVGKVQRQQFQSQDYDFYPFTEMVERHGIRAEIMYEYQGEITDRTEETDGIDVSLNVAKLPLMVSVDHGGADGGYRLLARYDRSVYSSADMERMLKMLSVIAVRMPSASDMDTIELLDDTDREEILALSAGPHLDLDIDCTFVKAFRECATSHPDSLAVEDEDGMHTYAELDACSDVLARILLDAGVRPDGFVALLLDRTWLIPLSVIAVHKAGAAYVPLDLEYPEQRLQFMLDDSGAAVLLTTRKDFENKRRNGLDTGKARVLFVEELDLTGKAEPVDMSTPEGNALMVYTSGSTGRPKGAVLHQAGLWNFICCLRNIYGHTAEDRIASHRTFSCVANVEDIFVILMVGGSLHIMPSGIRKDLDMVHEYLSSHRITGCGFIASVTMLLLKNYELNLRYITAGGEALSGVVNTGCPQVIQNYGPTECTDDTSIYLLEKGREYDRIPVGKTLPNNWMFVVSPDGKLLPHGVAGELCFAGIQVVKGYWNNPELTARKFCDCPFVERDYWGRPVRMYHTGDLVRWNEDGYLEHIGRIDNQFKVRGFRIEPGEIENAALRCDGVVSAVAALKNDILCLYYIGEASKETIKAELSKTLADYMVPGIFIHLEAMPLTPSGKIDRKSLPEPEIHRREYIAPANERERIIAESMSVILGLTDPVSVEERFISLGGNSISAMRLSSLLRKRSVRIATVDILRLQTVRAMAATVPDDCTQGRMSDTESATVCSKGVPLHESARFSYLEWERDHDTLKNNIPTAMHFSKHAADVVKPALEKLFAAHPYLNVRLYLSGGVPYQRLDRDLAVEINHRMLASPPDEPFFKSLVRPYNLIESPLYRIELIESAGMEGCWLFIDINHVICDGYSRALLLRDLSRVLAGDELPNVDTGALNHSGYEQKHQCDLTSHDSYFDGLMQGISPTVFPSSRYGTGDSEVVYSKVPADLVRSYVRLVGITENNVFLTAVLSVLQRLSDSDDVSLTMGHCGRGNPEIAESVGMFVKTWPVVGRSINTLSWREATESIQEQVLNTSSLEYYPFERLLSRYGWHPEITFIYEGNMEYSGISIPGAEFVSSVWNCVPSMTPVWIGASLQDDSYVLAVKYDGLRYSGRDMRRLADCIADTVARGCQSPEMILGESELLSESERQEIMAISTGETVLYDTSKTCVDAIVSNASRYPDHQAIVAVDGLLTYGELDGRSNMVANWLIDEGIRKGSFVAMRLPEGTDFYIAALGIMKAGCGYIPMDITYPEERLDFMLRDSGASIVITPELMDGILNDGNASSAPVNLSEPEGPSMLLYTSGSTGEPKGAYQQHKSLWTMAAGYIHDFGIAHGYHYAAVTSPSYALSLPDTYGTLCAGATLYISGPELRKDISALADYINDNNIRGFGISTALGSALINSGIRLGIEYMILAGEKAGRLNKTDYVLWNGLGSTETHYMSYHRIDGTEEVIPLGRPAPNMKALLLDSRGSLVPRGYTGELCIEGDQLVKGYWHREELTSSRFRDGVYHTGDLAYWNEDGELMPAGRKDNMVKVRGYRIELEEIERCAMKVMGVTGAAAAVRGTSSEPVICLFYTGESEIDFSGLERALPRFMLPSRFVRLDSLPLNVRGKLDRSALPELKAGHSADIISPLTATEQRICDQVSIILGTDDFGVTTDLLKAGLSSIGAMKLCFALDSQGIGKLHVSEILNYPTIREIAGLCKRSAGTSEFIFGAVHPKREYYPLTRNQLGVYIDCQRNPDGIQYNNPSVTFLPEMSADDIVRVTSLLTDAHPYLKCRIETVDGTLMQHRRDEATPDVLIGSIPSNTDPGAFFQSRVRPFNLEGGELCRVEVYPTDGGCWLFTDLHHIITDGYSDGLRGLDVKRLLSGGEVAQESYTAYDYAVEEEEYSHTEAYAADREYFRQLLEGLDTTIYPGTASGAMTGLGKETLSLPKSAVCEGAFENGVTANVFILSSLSSLLKSVTREERVLLATVSSGRESRSMEHTQGFFVKTIPLVYESDMSSLQRQLSESISHQQYPFTEMVSSFGIRPSVLYTFEGGLGITGKREGLSLDTAKFPLSITVFPAEEEYYVECEYDRSMYSDGDIQTLLHCLETIVSTGRLVTEEEERQLIELGTGEKLDYDKSKTFIDLFTEQVCRIPDSIAVVDKDSQLTYKELDEESNAVAHWLIEEHDIKPNDFVAVMLPRRKEFVTAVLGIWKAGAAYVPIDSEYPEERKRFILEDSGAKVVLSRESFVKIRTDFRILRVSFAQNTNPDNLAYMIYTSGSTGVPKGAMLTHRGLTNYALANVMICGLSTADRIAAHFSFSFSAHIIDIYPVLAAGASVFIIPEEDRKDTESLYHFLESNSISGCYLPSSLASLMYNQYTLHLRYLGATGEKVLGMVSGKNGVQVINGYGSSEGTDLTSTYTLLSGVDYQSNVPIGRPMPNCYVLIVDKSLHLIPRGEVGELCFAGCQVGKGYWNNRDLTAEKFVDCPYLPGEKMYRTGDLVRWNDDGNLEYIGRIDNQVKLGGYRIELGEIESAAAKVEGVSQAIAAVKNETLCLYYTGEAAEESIRTELSKTLTGYMVPDIYIHLDSMPLTPNGKIDRKSLPEPQYDTKEYVSPESDAETQLQEIAALVLNIEPDKISVTEDLITLGLNSLKAMRLVSRINAEYQCHLGLQDIMDNVDIRRIAALLETCKVGCPSKYHSYPNRQKYPVPAGMLGYMNGDRQGNISTHTTFACRFGGVSASRMETALREMIAAHPSLRVLLKYDGNEPVMCRNEQDIPIKIIHIDHEPDSNWIWNNAECPEHVLDACMMAFTLIQTPSTLYFFLYGSHAVLDASVIEIIMTDISLALSGQKLVPESYTIFDYSIDEDIYYKSVQYEKDKQYYRLLTGDRKETLLPYDKVKTLSGNKHGSLDFLIDKSSVDDYCSKHGVFLSTFFAVCYMQALGKLTDEGYVFISSLHSNRGYPEHSSLASLLIRTFPLLTENIIDVDSAGFAGLFLEEVRSIQKQIVYATNLRFFDYYGMKGPGWKIDGRNSKTCFICNAGLSGPYEKALNNLAEYGFKPETSIASPKEANKGDDVEFAVYVNETGQESYKVTIQYDVSLYLPSHIAKLKKYMEMIVAKIM